MLQFADEGATVRVKVTATNPDDAVSVASAATAEVAAAPPVNTIVPLLTGTAQRTKSLSATPGTWTGPGNTFTYQWQRDTGSAFADITGATTNSYVLATADVGF